MADKMSRREARPYFVMAFNSIDPLNKENYIRAFDTIVEALDQPEIIYCNDCKHMKECMGAYDDYCICARDPLHPFRVDSDGRGFCKWGERK